MCLVLRLLSRAGRSLRVRRPALCVPPQAAARESCGHSSLRRPVTRNLTRPNSTQLNPTRPNPAQPNPTRTEPRPDCGWGHVLGVGCVCGQGAWKGKGKGKGKVLCAGAVVRGPSYTLYIISAEEGSMRIVPPDRCSRPSTSTRPSRLATRQSASGASNSAGARLPL